MISIKKPLHAINKRTQVQINISSKTEMLETNAWSRIKATFVWSYILGKKINAQAFFSRKYGTIQNTEFVYSSVK